MSFRMRSATSLLCGEPLQATPSLRGKDDRRCFELKCWNASASESERRFGKDTIFQLKIAMLGTKPPIWRRVEVKDCTLARLHEIIQVAMGWEFSHLYDFEVGGERYGDPGMGDDLEWKHDRKMKLSQIVKDGYRKFGYVYDMGDNWEHAIQVEKTLAPSRGQVPRCIGGARACPPEDCGGIWGYEEFLGPSATRSTSSTRRCLNGSAASSTGGVRCGGGEQVADAQANGRPSMEDRIQLGVCSEVEEKGNHERKGTRRNSRMPRKVEDFHRVVVNTNDSWL